APAAGSLGGGLGFCGGGGGARSRAPPLSAAVYPADTSGEKTSWALFTGTFHVPDGASCPIPSHRCGGGSDTTQVRPEPSTPSSIGPASAGPVLPCIYTPGQAEPCPAASDHGRMSVPRG